MHSLKRILLKFKFIRKTFFSSQKYWIHRYMNGENSGAGSYSRLAEFKAEIINKFVLDNHIKTIIEYGCGDGNQLKYAKYPSYIGFDISKDAIALCKKVFGSDSSKTFKTLSEYSDEKSDLTLSLDVIYHLTEKKVFMNYMLRLFHSSLSFVVIYSSDTNQQIKAENCHIKQRKFTDWVKKNLPNWELIKHIPNKYPYNPKDPENTSISDFFIYQRIKL